MNGRLIAAVAAVALAVAAPAHAALPQVDAHAYVIANAATGDVLAQQSADKRLPIASITKLMTVLVALQHLKLDDVVTVSTHAAAVGEESIGLRAGQRISVRDLVKGTLIQSANDAANALADAASDGDPARFAGWMNAAGRRFGLTRTRFVRPDGLDAPGQLSSAHDVLRLAQVAMHNATIRSTVRERTDTLTSGRSVHTWNDLLGSYPGLIGVKTGHTSAAGWCEVAAAQRSGYTVYAVVLGSSTRATRNTALRALLSWGVSRYRLAPLVVQGRAYARVDPGWGKRDLALVATRRLLRPYRIDRPVVERVITAGAVTLPVQRGERFGRVEIWEGKRLLGVRPLVAARSIPRPGLPGRIAFYAGRTVDHVLGFVS